MSNKINIKTGHISLIQELICAAVTVVAVVAVWKSLSHLVVPLAAIAIAYFVHRHYSHRVTCRVVRRFGRTVLLPVRRSKMAHSFAKPSIEIHGSKK